MSDWNPLAPAELRKRGIEMINSHAVIVGCLTCGRTWSPMLPLRRDWWKCPHGQCNHDALAEHRAAAGMAVAATT